MSSLALFLAVGGGTAFAVVSANQVNSTSIIDGQVKKPDLAANSVGTGKVIDNSLTGADVQGNTLQGVNAATLGGKPPTDFQGHCDRGAALAAFRLRGRADFPAEYSAATTDIEPLSPNFCKSGVVARRNGAGDYEVCFPRGAGLPVAAVANATQDTTSINEAHFVTFVNLELFGRNDCAGPAVDRILKVSIFDAATERQDRNVFLVTF